MKIVAGILGLLSGIFGVIGGFFQVGFGAAMGDETTDGGVTAFWLSWLIIIVASMIFAKPKISGIILIILAIITFSNGNYFSAPFAIVAGIVAVISPTTSKQKN